MEKLHILICTGEPKGGWLRDIIALNSTTVDPHFLQPTSLPYSE